MTTSPLTNCARRLGAMPFASSKRMRGFDVALMVTLAFVNQCGAPGVVFRQEVRHIRLVVVHDLDLPFRHEHAVQNVLRIGTSGARGRLPRFQDFQHDFSDFDRRRARQPGEIRAKRMSPIVGRKMFSRRRGGTRLRCSALGSKAEFGDRVFLKLDREFHLGQHGQGVVLVRVLIL